MAERITKKTSFCGDPGQNRPRKTPMMFDASPAEIMDARQRPAAYAARAHFGRRAELVKAQETEDWTAHLLAVRDRQDRAAFAALFRHFAPRIKGFLVKSGSSSTVAEECAQDVMATLWQKAHLFDPERASVTTWIFTIARNRRIDMARRAARPEPEDLPWGPEAEPDQQASLELAQETELLGKALARLPQAQRALIEKAFYGDLSHSEIAAETGLPMGTVKSRIRLALDKLRLTFEGATR